MGEGIVEGAGVTEFRAILDAQPGFCCVAFVPVPSDPGMAPRPRRGA